jgi:hypothetical protein
MGCGTSKEETARPAPSNPHLQSPKWEMLSQWTEWHKRDMFGWVQPTLQDVVGPHGRSKLSGIERPHEYQVRERLANNLKV